MDVFAAEALGDVIELREARLPSFASVMQLYVRGLCWGSGEAMRGLRNYGSNVAAAVPPCIAFNRQLTTIGT
jgi:hypothetical protein